MCKEPLLSIIITSYTTERMEDIYELLDSIEAQAYPNVETIFIAERSVDLLNRIKAYAGKKDTLRLRVLFNDGEPGLSVARNLGIGAAAGEIIAFIDDDVVLPTNWADQMVKGYQDDTVIGVTGAALPLWEDESMSWLPVELYWIVSCTGWCDWKEVTEVRNAWGMNMSFRAEAFQGCGLFARDCGFHKGPMAEDNEFSQRVKAKTGKKIVYCPGVTLWHRVHKYRLSLGFVKERAYWIGHSRRMLKRLYSQADRDKDLLNPEHRLLRRIITRLLPNTFKTFFSNPVIAWRQLEITTTALSFVALGFYFPDFLLGGQRQLANSGKEI